jgi:hypothetical protein
MHPKPHSDGESFEGKSSTAPFVDSSHYRRIVETLRYLVNTRLDLAYVVSYVSRFMKKPTIEHVMAVKRVRYIDGMLDLGCHYRRKKGVGELISYNDSDLVGDVDTHQSTKGVLFFLHDSLITWRYVKAFSWEDSWQNSEEKKGPTPSC